MHALIVGNISLIKSHGEFTESCQQIMSRLSNIQFCPLFFNDESILKIPGTTEIFEIVAIKMPIFGEIIYW